MSKKPTPKPKVAVTSPPEPTRLIVKKDLIRTGTPVTFNGKRLNGVVGDMLDYFFVMAGVSIFVAFLGVVLGNGWLIGIGLAVAIYSGYGFFRYIGEWQPDREKVEEQLYVELPPRNR